MALEVPVERDAGAGLDPVGAVERGPAEDLVERRIVHSAALSRSGEGPGHHVVPVGLGGRLDDVVELGVVAGVAAA